MLAGLATRLSGFATQNNSRILTAIGVAGVIGTAILSATGTVKTVRTLDENPEVTETKDKVKLVYKNYIPAAMTGIATIACLVSVNAISERQATNLATALAVSNAAAKRYKEQVKKTIGEKKEAAVNEAAHADLLKNFNKETIVITSAGRNTLFFDEQAGQPFRSDMQTVKAAINEINHQIYSNVNSEVALADFYHLLGLRGFPAAQNLGWTAGQKLDVTFACDQVLELEEPCFVLSYQVHPLGYDSHKTLGY